MSQHSPDLERGGALSNPLDFLFQLLEKYPIHKNYYLRIFVQALLTIWAVMSITFVLVRLMPGNPVDILIEQILTQEGISYQEAYDRVAASFNIDPDATMLDQYWAWFADLLRLDLGESITSPGTLVIDEIARFLPWTLFAVGTGLLLSFVLGVALGMTMAYYRDSALDHALSLVSSFFTGVPNYIWGLLIIIGPGISWQWFDVGAVRGTYDPGLKPGLTLEFLASVIEHALLPIITYVLATLGGWMLSMKSSTTSVLNDDYVNVAEARGLQDRRIISAYVGRNAALPLFTQLSISVGFALGSGIVIEEIFVYWGFGHYLFQAITVRDYTGVQGAVLILTMAVVFANLFADLSYGMLDPRVRISGAK